MRADHWRCRPRNRNTSGSVALQEQRLEMQRPPKRACARPKCAFAARDVPSGLDEPEDKVMLWRLLRRMKSPLTCSGWEGSSCCPITLVKSRVEASPLHLAGSPCPSAPPRKITSGLRKNLAEGRVGETASSTNMDRLSPGPMSNPNLTNSLFKLSSTEIAKQCLISGVHTWKTGGTAHSCPPDARSFLWEL